LNSFSWKTNQTNIKQLFNTYKMSKRVKKNDKSTIVSWVLHALKIVLGDESIREEIIMHYNPDLHKGNLTRLKRINDGSNHKHHVITFNAFIEPGKTREDKIDKIQDYLEKIVEMPGTVAFTATNVQQDENDFETHFQSFIVDNDAKRVTMIDPAYDKKKRSGKGIYHAEIAREIVKPFFKFLNMDLEEEDEYKVRFLKLTNPAQIAHDDVFCQSWSLFMLNSLLENDAYKTTQKFKIPESQTDKYNMILKFYKRIFTDIPNLRGYLKAEYEGEVSEDNLLEADPYKVLMSMTKADMAV
jgi:hypothetical protein